MRRSCPAGSALECLDCEATCSWAAGTLQGMLRSHEARVANYTAGCRAGGDCQCIANRSCCAYGGADPCYLYNELVLSATSLANLVPGAVEAVYYVTGTTARSAAQALLGETAARAIREVLAQVGSGPEPPLLSVDFSRVSAPFRADTT